MSRKEVPRAGLLKAALAGKISNAQGARALHLSVRQFQRVKRRFAAEGAPRAPAPAARPAVAPPAAAGRRVRRAWPRCSRAPTPGFNDCHATEKLREVEGLPLSRASVRRLRRALGLPAKRRRRRRQGRTRRTPEAQMGALVQLDASPFAWLETRGPQLTLHGAIDDATGTVPGPRTSAPPRTCTATPPCCSSSAPPTACRWPSTAIASTSSSATIRTGRSRNNCAAPRTPRISAASCRSLGIGFIAAGSPQAKGRIERLWQTLQDRLVSELRLRGIATLEAANAFLPAFLADFNRRFARAPADPTAAWRPAPRDLAAAPELSLHARRRPRQHRPPRPPLGPAAAPPRLHRPPRRGARVPRRPPPRLRRRPLPRHAARARRRVHPPPPPQPQRRSRPRAAAPLRAAPPRGAAIPLPPENAPFSRTSAPAAARTPSPTHPWRHSTPYSTRAGG